MKNDKDPRSMAEWEKQVTPMPSEVALKDLFTKAAVASQRAANRFPAKKVTG